MPDRVEDGRQLMNGTRWLPVDGTSAPPNCVGVRRAATSDDHFKRGVRAGRWTRDAKLRVQLPSSFQRTGGEGV